MPLKYNIGDEIYVTEWNIVDPMFFRGTITGFYLTGVGCKYIIKDDFNNMRMVYEGYVSHDYEELIKEVKKRLAL